MLLKCWLSVIWILLTRNWARKLVCKGPPGLAKGSQLHANCGSSGSQLWLFCKIEESGWEEQGAFPVDWSRLAVLVGEFLRRCFCWYYLPLSHLLRGHIFFNFRLHIFVFLVKYRQFRKISYLCRRFAIVQSAIFKQLYVQNNFQQAQ